VIELQEINQDNWRAALKLTVLPEQQGFVSEPGSVAAIAISKAFVGYGGMRWMPYTVLSEGQMVGFFVLARKEEERFVWLRHFFIDQNEQGKVYGKAAHAALKLRVAKQMPAIDEIHLTVHPENAVARSIYTNAEFEPTGEWMSGEPIYRCDLTSLGR
jgi:diamine N-acetyltransferase